MGKPEDCKTFADRLKWALAHAGKEPRHLQEHLKVTRAAIHPYVREVPDPNRVMKADHAARTAVFLGVATDWLAAGIGPWERQFAWKEDTISLATKYEQVTSEQRLQAHSVLDIFVSKRKDGTDLPDKFREIEESRERAANTARKDVLYRRFRRMTLIDDDDST